MSRNYLQTVADIRELLDGKTVKDITGDRSISEVRFGIDKLVRKMSDPYSVLPKMPKCIYQLRDMRNKRVQVLAVLREVEKVLINLRNNPKVHS